jgi:hypothetical protein
MGVFTRLFGLAQGDIGAADKFLRLVAVFGIAGNTGARRPRL